MEYGLHQEDCEEVVFVELICKTWWEGNDDVEAHVVDKSKHEDAEVVCAFIRSVVLNLAT